MATPSERGITDDERGTRDRGRFGAEEADLRGRADRAGVRSIVRSGPHRGRLVFDPERRILDRPRERPPEPTLDRALDLGKFATLRTGADKPEGSIDIEVPLLGYPWNRPPTAKRTRTDSRTGKVVKVESDPHRKVKALPRSTKEARAKALVDSAMQAMETLAADFDNRIVEYEKVDVLLGYVISKGEKTGEDKVVAAGPYRIALQAFAETLNAIIHPITYAWKIRHPSLVDNSIPFVLEPPPELPVERGKPNPNRLEYEGQGYTIGFDAAVNAAEVNDFATGDNRWLMEHLGWYTLEDRMVELIQRKHYEWFETTVRRKAQDSKNEKLGTPVKRRSETPVNIGWPGVR
jgi:hypothetical protein